MHTIMREPVSYDNGRPKRNTDGDDHQPSESCEQQTDNRGPSPTIEAAPLKLDCRMISSMTREAISRLTPTVLSGEAYAA